ncbi:MAG: hypothetical protein H0W68_05875 [Gemmatimonadaceae bacterium]|nr:hypothetical protein [Gemmatimonadaceae bacterium]
MEMNLESGRSLASEGRISRSARRVVLALVMMVAGVSAGCTRSAVEEQAAEPVPKTQIRVDNQAFNDMTIYVYRSSQRIRLGTATGSSTTRLVIPASLLFGATPLRFQADPIGGNRTPITEEITVSPGDEVRLTIPAR